MNDKGRFEDLVLWQETGITRGSQNLAGGRTNSGGSLGGGSTTAGDEIPNVDAQVAIEALDTRLTGETSLISPARMIKELPPPFSGSEKDWGTFKDDITTFVQYHGFAYVLTSRRHIKLDATTTAQSVVAEGHEGAIR